MKEFEIVDISFGERATEEVETLLKIFPTYMDIKRQNQYTEEQNKWLMKTSELYREFIDLQKDKFGDLANDY